jgi:hypothetical protein
MTKKIVCQHCKEKWAQDGRYCRSCARSVGIPDPVTCRTYLPGDFCEVPKRRTAPPPRPQVVRTFRNPWTGELQDFEVVWP